MIREIILNEGKKQGFKLNDLAEIAELDRRTFKRWAKGSPMINTNAIDKLILKLNIKFVYLIDL